MTEKDRTKKVKEPEDKKNEGTQEEEKEILPPLDFSDKIRDGSFFVFELILSER